MNILLSIHHHLGPDSGAPGVTLALGNSLRSLGHGVDFVSFDQMPTMPDRLARLLYPLFFTLRMHGRDARKLDVVDASTGDSWLWADLHRRRGARPLLVSRSHGLEHLFHLATLERKRAAGERAGALYRTYHGGFRLWEVARNLRQADIAIFLNPTERDYAVEHLAVDPARARVVPNGIPESLLAAPLDPAPSDPATPVGLAQLGAWRTLKGIDDSVATMTSVLRAHPQETVAYLGTGVTPMEVRGRFPAGLRDRVEVVPRYQREDLPRLLRGRRLQLFPSASEGFGLSLLEGMACGLAPVASRTAGPKSFVEDGRNGLLSEIGDPAAMTAALERLLDDRPLLRRMQEAARRTASTYSQGTIASRTAAIYEEALLARAAAPGH